MIRNDIGRGLRLKPPFAPSNAMAEKYPDTFAPDAVLYSCPQCGRNHLVALECPPADAMLVRGPGGAMVVLEDASC